MIKKVFKKNEKGLNIYGLWLCWLFFYKNTLTLLLKYAL